MMNQPTLNLETRNSKPETVECLGQTFASDEARREHYLKLLTEKLKDPEFRKIEGFTIGRDEDIIALSDPPYYTACPKPWLAEFIKFYGTPYDPKVPYHHEPFGVDVSEGKNHPQLKAKAKDRWYVPDPKKNVDVETLRNKRLLEDFWTYLPEGYTSPALTANKGQTLPGLIIPRPKIPKGKKLKEIRTEAVRVGFKHCYQQKDYQTILVVAELVPESVLNEDEQLQMIYDTAVTRTGAEN